MSEAAEKPPGRNGMSAFFLGVFGVLLPLVALVVELLTDMSAGLVLDPLPTPLHVLLVLLVIVSNARTQRAVVKGTPVTANDLRLAGASLGVCLVYAAAYAPTYPVMIFATLFYGLGLLPYAPLAAGLTGLLDRRALGQAGQLPEGGPSTGRWVLAGVLAVALVDLPGTITQMALVSMEKPLASGERALARQLLRTIGSEREMLRACWWNRRQAPGPFAGLARMAFGTVFPDDARHAYFRVTGKDPSTQPEVDPEDALMAVQIGRRWDADQGGREIGRATPGLWMTHSQLVGSLAPEAAVGYLEWTWRFRNDQEFQEREARAMVRLPPGAVVSRLTLWVNGEPQEAAFAGRAQVRSAYESVVRRSRDPVLVTTAGRDRIMVQCYPVLPKGGEMKVRLGITTPLKVGPAAKAGLELPWIEASNFALDASLAPHITLASRGALTASGAGTTGGWLTPTKGAGDLRKVLQELPGAADQPHLLGGTLRAHQGSRIGRVLVARDPGSTEAVAEDSRQEDDTVIHQVLEARPPPRPSALIVAVEASAPLAPYREAIAAFLTTLPPDLPVALRVADDESSDRGSLAADRVPPTPAAGPSLAARLQATPFVGGQDAHPVLNAALADLTGTPGAAVLWLHGPNPPWLDWARSTRRSWREATDPPALWHLQLTPGVNYALRELESLPGMRSLARSGDPSEDLATLADELAGRVQLVRASRRRVAPGSLATGTPREESGLHLVRLWAQDEILRRLGEAAPSAIGDGPAPTDPRIQLAHTYQLVTPVSGAVVLESQEQYDEAGLTPGDPGKVPTIPEPSTGLLLLVVGGALGLRRREGDEGAGGDPTP